MQTAKVVVTYNHIDMDVIFVTIDHEDSVICKILSDDDPKILKGFLKFLTVKMLDMYNINATQESISFEKFDDDGMCITIVPQEHLDCEEMEALTDAILPQTLPLPIWDEWDERYFLAELVQITDNSKFQKSSKNAKGVLKNTETSLCNTCAYEIPSLNSLLNFTKLNGTVVEEDGNLYLLTADNLCEFFDEYQDSLHNATVVVSDVGTMLKTMKEAEEKEDVER